MVLGFVMFPLCFSLSVAPAVWFASVDPNAGPLSLRLAGVTGHLAPWLYYLSMTFRYLTIAALALVAAGAVWFVRRRKHET